MLIQQGLRVDTELGPLTTPCELRPVCVRALSGVCPWLSESRSVSLAANSKPDGATEYDQDKVDEMVLALLSLTMFEEDPYGVRA